VEEGVAVRVHKLLLLSTTALVAVAVVAVACGGGEEEAGGTETPVPRETPGGGLAGQPEPPQVIAEEVTEPVDGVIETEMGDNFFVQNNLRVALGESVTIRAINDGQAIHNLRVAGVDGEWETDDDFVTDPEIIRAGESGDVVFTPEVAGAYTFRCDFHPTEMGGVIVVE
jgi:plastocyanin